MAMGCQQCLPLSVVQLKGKHCRKPHCRNGVVDTLGQCSMNLSNQNAYSWLQYARLQMTKPMTKPMTRPMTKPMTKQSSCSHQTVILIN
jgi:hypothetical protein